MRIALGASQLRSTPDAGLEARADDLVAAVRSGQEADVQLDPLAQLYDSGGTPLAGSPSLRDERLLDAGDVRDSADGELVTRTLPVGPDGAATPVRLLVRHADAERVLVVGASAESVETARERLFLVLFIAAPLLVVVPAVAGDDEIARLARTLDDMLARLRVAFAREQGFVDDASHELRTPIESVLGVGIAVEGDPVVVEADPRQLRQLLSNLAGNSAAAGAATVRVRIERRHDAVIVEVADDGPGFAPDVLRSAFDRFVRGDDARTRGSAGAGLGLSIVRAIVTAHGGTVDAGNGGPLGGAVVTARLPALGPDRRS